MGNFYAILSGASAGICVGFAKFGVQAVPLIPYNFFLTCFAFLISLVFNRGLENWPKKNRLPFIGHCFFSFLGLLTFSAGLIYLPAAVAGFLSVSEIPMAVILAHLILKEKLHAVDLIAGLGVIAGILLMQGKTAAGDTDGIGVQIILFSSLCFAFAEVLAKFCTSNLSPLGFSQWRSLLMLIFFTCLIPFYEWLTPDYPTLLIILAVSFFGPFMARIFFMLSLKAGVTVSRSVILGQTHPLVTALFMFLLTGEILDGQQMLGGCIILLCCGWIASARN